MNGYQKRDVASSKSSPYSRGKRPERRIPRLFHLIPAKTFSASKSHWSLTFANGNRENLQSLGRSRSVNPLELHWRCLGRSRQWLGALQAHPCLDGADVLFCTLETGKRQRGSAYRRTIDGKQCTRAETLQPPG